MYKVSRGIKSDFLAKLHAGGGTKKIGLEIRLFCFSKCDSLTGM